MSDLLKFLGPWLQLMRNLKPKRHLKRIRRGEYGNAALYREWRLLEQQVRDNAEGRFGRIYLKIGE